MLGGHSHLRDSGFETPITRVVIDVGEELVGPGFTGGAGFEFAEVQLVPGNRLESVKQSARLVRSM